MPAISLNGLWPASNKFVSGSGSNVSVSPTGGEADVGKYLPDYRVGQWWAQKKPVCLLRVSEVDDRGMSSVVFDMWAPGRHQDLIHYINGPAVPLVFLWFKREFTSPVFDDPEWTIGASHVCLRNERIFFIGPRSGNGFTVHAAREVNDADLCNCAIFQPGALVEPPPQTAFEQLNTDIDR